MINPPPIHLSPLPLLLPQMSIQSLLLLLLLLLKGMDSDQYVHFRRSSRRSCRNADTDRRRAEQKAKKQRYMR
jgi:hypothetical protein